VLPATVLVGYYVADIIVAVDSWSIRLFQLRTSTVPTSRRAFELFLQNIVPDKFTPEYIG
jgi:hypothetical protein